MHCLARGPWGRVFAILPPSPLHLWGTLSLEIPRCEDSLFAQDREALISVDGSIDFRKYHFLFLIVLIHYLICVLPGSHCHCSNVVDHSFPSSPCSHASLITNNRKMVPETHAGHSECCVCRFPSSASFFSASHHPSFVPTPRASESLLLFQSILSPISPAISVPSDLSLSLSPGDVGASVTPVMAVIADR